MQGGLEFVDRHTTIDAPYFVGQGGVLISTTDILPTELRKLLAIHTPYLARTDHSSDRRFYPFFSLCSPIRRKADLEFQCPSGRRDWSDYRKSKDCQ
jgi:hypothetical protein